MPVDLGIDAADCLLHKAVAEGDDPSRWSHIGSQRVYGIANAILRVAACRRNNKAERYDGAGAKLGTVSADR